MGGEGLTLAIFDLDNTLLAGDSDHAWGEFLVEEGMVDAEEYKRANDRFYQEYLNGAGCFPLPALCAGAAHPPQHG